MHTTDHECLAQYVHFWEQYSVILVPLTERIYGYMHMVKKPSIFTYQNAHFGKHFLPITVQFDVIMSSKPK